MLFIFFAFLMGCSSVQVSQDYLPETPEDRFFDLKTYQWQSEKQKLTGNQLIDNPLLIKRIRTAIDHTLAEKGYRLITDGEPDFVVAYSYSLRAKIESGGSGSSVGFGFGTFGRFGGVGIRTGQEIREYDQATLLIDLINPQSGDLLWRGNGTRRVGQHPTPEKTTKMINEMVLRILDQFPPLPS
jgi:hypothetical protein